MSIEAPVGRVPRRTRRERLAVIGSRLGPYARPHRHQLRLALAASVAVTLAQLAMPWPLAWLVDLAGAGGGGGSGAPSWLTVGGDPAVSAMTALVLVGAVLGGSEYVQRVAIARYVVRSINDARVGILTGSLADQAVVGTGKKRDPGDVVTRVVNDTARLRIGMKGTLVHLLQHGLFLVGVSIVLLLLDVWLGVAYLGGLGVALSVAVVGADRTAALSRRRRERESRVVDGAMQVATSPGDELTAKPLDRERSVPIISQLKGRTAVAVQVLLALAACLVLTLAVHFASSGRLATGDVALVASYLVMLHYPMMRMGRQITRLGPQLTSAERLATLARPTEPDAQGA
ncbi:MAG: ABC transporter transmembrane domain-containing protein [Nocardioidaceae bacterium]